VMDSVRVGTTRTCHYEDPRPIEEWILFEI